MSRFEAVYYEGEYGERMPAWEVIEWTYVNLEKGLKKGKTVESFVYEKDACELAAELQEKYDIEFDANFS